MIVSSPSDLDLHRLQRQDISLTTRTRVNAYFCWVKIPAVSIFKYFLFPRKKRLWHSLGNNLNEISKHIFLGNLRKSTVSLLSAEFFQRVLMVELLEPSNRLLGPVVQSLVSLMSSLRVILLTVLADSICNILIFFAEKMWVAQKLLTFFQQKIPAYKRITRWKF